MILDVDIAHEQGAFALRARFRSDGKLTALFGPSGSGKTTIVNAIGGLVRPDRGRIAVQGRVLVDTKSNILVPKHRRRIGTVFQEGRLFPHLNVRHNLLFGRWFTPKGERKASFDRVVDLLGIAHLLDRRPATLSGGEKQRVAIGRTILKGPPILVLDEATSALDSFTEKEIQDALDRVSRGRTTLVIAHRLSTVIGADEIIVLDKGVVVERGSHTVLLAKGGVYAAMWNRQREADQAREALKRVEQEEAAEEEADAVPSRETVAG